MASTDDEMETIELSEAIKTILEEEGESEENDEFVAASGFTTPKTRKPCMPSNSSSQQSGGGLESSPTGQRASAKQSAETPLSRKSSILSRSLGGGDYSGEMAQKKRRHAHEVIILRPPKKRLSSSTPRVTSTSKFTPSTQSTPNTSDMPLRQKSFHSTPVSSMGRSRPNILSRQNRSKRDNKIGRADGGLKKVEDNPGLTPDVSLTASQMYNLLDGGENLSPKDQESLALQARYLSMMERMAGDGGISRSQDGDGGEQIGSGGLSLNIADQTSKISLVARGNQDDSLTNITWLRRMSAPDLDPITLQHLKKNQDPHGERPPYSYSALIQFAISSAPEGKLTLRDIYFWIETHFPYFRTAKLGWKNSIRHNLSLHKIFVREAPTGPGQPAFWTLRPGTVVRLPERKVVIHDEMGYRANLQDCFLPDGAPVDMAPMGTLQMPVDPMTMTGNNMLMGNPAGIPMLPGQDGNMMNRAPVLTSTPVLTRPSSKGPKRVPPILPKGTPPYALVPLPIYFTTDPRTGQLVQARGDNMAPMGGMGSPILPATTTGSKHKNIAPKVNKPNTPTRKPQSTMVQPTTATSIGRTIMDSGYGSADSTLGDDANALSVRDSLLLKNAGEAKNEIGKENALSSEFELGLDVDDDLLKTPPKTVCPDWLSPIRGFTPGLDSGFPVKDMDFNFTPFKTGFTPNNRMGHSNTPRHLMLSPVNRNIPGFSIGVRSGRKARMATPKRCVDRDTLGTSLHNSSFDQIFGDVNFDVDPDDVGNMSWLLQSPPPAK